MTAVALDAFLSEKVRIDAALARLTALSDEHFNLEPDEIHWGHVGTLRRYREQLENVCASAFGEGEYAPAAE